jgi:hypothetical protein
LICGSKGWPCSYTPDRRIRFCGKVYSEKQSSDGVTYLHFADDVQTAPRFVEKPAPQVKVVERAGADHLHAVYSALLDRLPLLPRHHDDLRRRGLPDELIKAGCYKSVFSDDERRELTRELAPLGLRGVPGFYRYQGEWQMVRCLPGFFVPYRDSRGRILGMMYRMDVMIDRQKFRWFSTPPDKYSDGTTSGAPLHFARPELFETAGEVWLTEGALKADIAAHYLNVPFIASGGVTQWGAKFGEAFKARFPDKRIIIAYDSDWFTNNDVRAALERLMLQLDAAHVPYVVRTWAEDAKGIDDLVVMLAQSNVKGAIAA